MAEPEKQTQAEGADSAAAAVLAEWDQANAGLTQGATFAHDIAIAGQISEELPPQDLWGIGLPEDMQLRLSSDALGTVCRRNDYLVGGRSGDWRDVLVGARAVLLPDMAAVGNDDQQSLRQFVRRGGVLVAFGHATLLDAAGNLQKDYALADLLAVRYSGQVVFDEEGGRVTVTGDSIWAPQYKPENVIDGAAETFWASVEAGPMPHWVEIAFGRPRTVAGAEVKCRPGFQLQDFQVQCKVNGDWVPAAQVTDNEEGAIDCPFEKPVETEAVRLFVTRESHQGADRVIADVGEFAPYDGSGQRLIRPPYLIEGRITEKAWAQANRTDRLVLRSPAVCLRSADAKVLASFPDPLSPGDEVPLCTRSKPGKGAAYLLTVPEGAVGEQPEAWEAILRTFVGMPLLRHSGDEQVVAFLREMEGRYLLNVVDTAPTDSEERAKEVIVRINTKAIGSIKSAVLVPGEQPLEVRRQEGWLQFTAPMAPLASVVLARK